MVSKKKLRPVIVTFKRKDERKEKKLDKQEILRRHVRGRVEFCDTLAVAERGALPGKLGDDPLALDVNLFELPLLTGSFTDEEIKALEQDPDVEMVEEDALAYATGGTAAERALEAPRASRLLAEDAASVLAEVLPWGVNRIDAERAWEVTRGAGIKVAVIDTGIDARHVDLAPNFAGGVSFVPGEDFTDGNGHGTHVAGTIGARENGSGVVGVAPNCRLYSAKALDRNGSGAYSWIISAIAWCVTNRMDVVNMSLGGPSDVQALKNACALAAQNDVLIVAAAGNSGPGANTVGFPGRYDDVLAVSAVDSADAIASFSSRGPEVDLAAPGVQILSTLPGNRYGSLNGTSMACPHVAGAAALAVSSHRFASKADIRRLLLNTADNLGVPGRDDEFGYGLVDAEQAAFARTL